MRAEMRKAAFCLMSVGVMAGCVTKSTFRREMNDRRNETNAERVARIQGDSSLSGEIASLRNDLQGLRTEFGAKITALEEGMKFDMPVHFAFDDAAVRPEDQAALDRFAEVVQKHYAGAVLTVEGFADPAGTTRYNLDLSRRRAEAVKGYLTTKGLGDEQVRAVGYGEARLVAKGAERDQPGAELNRRVVFVVEAANPTPADSTKPVASSN